MIKGYELADGSYSSEYKVGDKFVVVSEHFLYSEGDVVELVANDKSTAPYFDGAKGKQKAISWYKLKPYTYVPTKQKLEQLLANRGEEVIEWLTDKLKEFDKRENIQRELEFAKAKRERLDKHIAVLEGKLK